MHMKKKLEEQIIQKFPYRCPYCEQPISYDQFNLKPGENEIQCLSCKRIYIKVVSNILPPPQSSPIKGEKKKGSLFKERVRVASNVKKRGEVLRNYPEKGKRNKNK